MNETDVVMGNLFVAPGIRAKVCINDVPMLPAPIVGSWSKQLPINHRLVEGENEVSVCLEEVGDAGQMRKSVDERGVKRFACVVFKKRPTSLEEDFDMLVDASIDGSWADVPEHRRRYPYHQRWTFTPQVPVAPPTWFTAERTSVPCEGTPELRQAVRDFYDAIVTADKSGMIALSEPLFSDYERAFPNEGYYARGQLIQEMDELLAQRPKFEPLEPEALHYEARAGGRVVHVSRLDGRSVLRARFGDNEGYRTDLLLTKTRDGWLAM